MKLLDSKVSIFFVYMLFMLNIITNFTVEQNRNRIIPSPNIRYSPIGYYFERKINLDGSLILCLPETAAQNSCQNDCLMARLAFTDFGKVSLL